jgi:lipid-A-disaccharide synthase-like uncharacterized protein
MKGASVFAYARWHARDAIGRAFVPAGFFLVTAGIQLALLVRAYGLDEFRGSEAAQGEALAIYTGSMPVSMMLGALLVGSGFVAADRERGHVRFLFSSPIVAWQYYLQRFVVGITLFVLATSLVPLILSAVLIEVPITPVILVAFVYASLLGSLAMLAGAFARRDGLVVIGITVAAVTFQGLTRAGNAPRWMELVAAVLPPIGKANGLSGDWFSGVPAHTPDLVLVLGYALAMLVTALFTIHRAPLVR